MESDLCRSNLLFLFLLIGSCSFAQSSYTGSWHGLITGRGLLNNTQYTVNIKTHEGDVITGKAYLYNNYLYNFYGIFDFIGTVQQNTCKITELRILSKEMPDELHGLCTKFCDMTYSANDTMQYLAGSWDNTSGSCPEGKVFLKKARTGAKAPDIPPPVLAKINEDRSTGISFLQTTLSRPVIIDVSSTQLKLTIRDYLKEDNDTISVYVNREPVIVSRKITKKGYSQNVRLDKLSGLNEIIMYAENLGTIPPNTCILVIDDGKRKQAVNIESTKQTSAAIYLRFGPVSKDINSKS
ncbi:hypothetical protein [Hufsiella ginkgonis]|uniref:Uncharacterized protein n=1 Tax=Hufsiella ginkgonis TaxID=2695274 RepID=A0A7K1Y3B2_9SPHI|nr:hypothetical protein [Hufsiella ginkgonis]MXV17166.1 hypothetical protein [Hufsiella ginkgonis]